VSRGFLLIGDSLYGRSRMAGGFMPTWIRAARFCRVWGVYLRICTPIGSGMVFGGALLGRGMWSLAVYKGRLFMGYNNGGRGAVLGIRVGCLSFKALDSILNITTDGVYLAAMLRGMELVHGVSIMCMSTTVRTSFSLGRIWSWCPKGGVSIFCQQ
jgi:hypothetical protein